MSQLLIKHKENIASAQLLIEHHNMFAPSIHCAYYSSVQLMIDILINDFDIKEDRITAAARKEGTGTHVFASNRIFKDIFHQDMLKARNFNNKIQSLRRRRENSDYFNFKVTLEYSKDALEEAQDTNELLIEHYKLEV